jgi:transcriptional regulator with XRE-family HTH domain
MLGKSCDACRMSEQPELRAVAGPPQWDRADRMRKALREAGMGPGGMAAYLGVGGNTVSTWLSGRVDPSVQTLRLWATRTGVPYAWLVSGDPDATPDDLAAIIRKRRLLELVVLTRLVA